MAKMLNCPAGHRWSAEDVNGEERHACPQCGWTGQDNWATLVSADEDAGLPTLPRALPSGVAKLAKRFANADAPPPAIPGYEILEKLGEGGMGVVYKARHVALDRIVALKVISRALLANPSALARFRREARAAARLSHANLVTVHDAGASGDDHFLVMEYVAGIDLAQCLAQRGALPPREACDYIRQAALGLEHAHERGLVHRDIKPSNLLVAPDGTVKLVDLGLALIRPGAADLAANDTLTQEGGFMGTPDYVAPEQALDPHAADIRADIYSLGCTLYHLVTGRPPFPGGSFAQKLLRHQQEEPAPFKPAAVLKIVRTMMAKKAADRYQTPGAVAEALASLTRPRDDRPANEERAASTLPHRSAPPRASSLSHRRWLLGVGALGILGSLFIALCWSLGLFSSATGRNGGKNGPNGPDPKDSFTNSKGMRLVRIPAGKFWQGSSIEEGSDNERPRRQVEITRDFYMGIHEVTQGQYEAVTGLTPSGFGKDKGGTSDHPVERVTWQDAAEFCAKLSALPAEMAKGRTYRLPTEAQWEYACRATTTTPVSFGKALDSTQANFDGRHPFPDDAARGRKLDRTARVGSYSANAWGMFDMHGNVCEWCADYFENGYYGNAPDIDPQGPDKSEFRAVRGGGLESPGFDCRSARREPRTPSDRHNSLGFRVICVIQKREAEPLKLYR
jgi:serine/threonine protein kinase